MIDEKEVFYRPRPKNNAPEINGSHSKINKIIKYSNDGYVLNTYIFETLLNKSDDKDNQSTCRGNDKISIVITQRPMQQKKQQTSKATTPEESAQRSRKQVNGPSLVTTGEYLKIMAKNCSTPDIHKAYVNRKQKKKSSCSDTHVNKSTPMNTKFIVNTVALEPHTISPDCQHFLKHPLMQAQMRIYRCQLGSQEEKYCQACDSEAFFDVLKGLYDCYANKNCVNCNCILCSSFHKARRKLLLGEATRSKVSVGVETVATKYKARETLKKSKDFGLFRTVVEKPTEQKEPKIMPCPKAPLSVQLEKLRKAQASGILPTLEGYTTISRERTSNVFVQSGSPLHGKKKAPDNKVINQVRKELGLPLESRPVVENERDAKVRAMGHIAPFEKKTQRETMLRAVAEKRTPSRDAKPILELMRKPLEARIQSEKIRRARIAGFLTPNETLEQNEITLPGSEQPGPRLVEGKTLSEKKLIDKIRKELCLTTPITKTVLERIIKPIISRNMSGPSVTLEKRRKLYDKTSKMIKEGKGDLYLCSLVTSQSNRKIETKTISPCRLTFETVKATETADLFSQLQGKSQSEKEKVIRSLANQEIPFPEARTPSEKKLAKKIRAQLGLPPAPSTKCTQTGKSEKVKAQSLITQAEVKTIAQKKKNRGSTDAPEQNTQSPKETSRKVQSACVITPLKGETSEQKALLTKKLKAISAKLPQEQTTAETTTQRTTISKSKGLVVTPERKSPYDKAKMLRRLAKSGLPLPEGRTPSDKELIKKIRTEKVLPLEIKPSLREKWSEARTTCNRVIAPFENKISTQAENIMKRISETRIQLTQGSPNGNTNSDKSEMKSVRSIKTSTGRVRKTKGVVTQMAAVAKQQIIDKDKPKDTCEMGCGCNKKKIRFKHSYVKIRVTSPDTSSFCSCPYDCPGVCGGAFPDNDGIKVTVETATGQPSYKASAAPLKQTLLQYPVSKLSREEFEDLIYSHSHISLEISSVDSDYTTEYSSSTSVVYIYNSESDVSISDIKRLLRESIASGDFDESLQGSRQRDKPVSYIYQSRFAISRADIQHKCKQNAPVTYPVSDSCSESFYSIETASSMGDADTNYLRNTLSCFSTLARNLGISTDSFVLQRSLNEEYYDTEYTESLIRETDLVPVDTLLRNSRFLIDSSQGSKEQHNFEEDVAIYRQTLQPFRSKSLKLLQQITGRRIIRPKNVVVSSTRLTNSSSIFIMVSTSGIDQHYSSQYLETISKSRSSQNILSKARAWMDTKKMKLSRFDIFNRKRSYLKKNKQKCDVNQNVAKAAYKAAMKCPASGSKIKHQRSSQALSMDTARDRMRYCTTDDGSKAEPSQSQHNVISEIIKPMMAREEVAQGLIKDAYMKMGYNQIPSSTCYPCDSVGTTEDSVKPARSSQRSSMYHQSFSNKVDSAEWNNDQYSPEQDMLTPNSEVSLASTIYSSIGARSRGCVNPALYTAQRRQTKKCSDDCKSQKSVKKSKSCVCETGLYPPASTTRFKPPVCSSKKRCLNIGPDSESTKRRHSRVSEDSQIDKIVNARDSVTYAKKKKRHHRRKHSNLKKHSQSLDNVRSSYTQKFDSDESAESRSLKKSFSHDSAQYRCSGRGSPPDSSESHCAKHYPRYDPKSGYLKKSSSNDSEYSYAKKSYYQNNSHHHYRKKYSPYGSTESHYPKKCSHHGSSESRHTKRCPYHESVESRLSKRCPHHDSLESRYQKKYPYYDSFESRHRKKITPLGSVESRYTQKCSYGSDESQYSRKTSPTGSIKSGHSRKCCSRHEAESRYPNKNSYNDDVKIRYTKKHYLRDASSIDSVNSRLAKKCYSHDSVSYNYAKKHSPYDSLTSVNKKKSCSHDSTECRRARRYSDDNMKSSCGKKIRECSKHNQFHHQKKHSPYGSPDKPSYEEKYSSRDGGEFRAKKKSPYNSAEPSYDNCCSRVGGETRQKKKCPAYDSVEPYEEKCCSRGGAESHNIKKLSPCNSDKSYDSKKCCSRHNDQFLCPNKHSATTTMPRKEKKCCPNSNAKSGHSQVSVRSGAGKCAPCENPYKLPKKCSPNDDLDSGFPQNCHNESVKPGKAKKTHSPDSVDPCYQKKCSHHENIKPCYPEQNSDNETCCQKNRDTAEPNYPKSCSHHDTKQPCCHKKDHRKEMKPPCCQKTDSHEDLKEYCCQKKCSHGDNSKSTGKRKCSHHDTGKPCCQKQCSHQDIGKPCCQKKCSNQDTENLKPKKKGSQQNIEQSCCQTKCSYQDTGKSKPKKKSSQQDIEPSCCHKKCSHHDAGQPCCQQVCSHQEIWKPCCQNKCSSIGLATPKKKSSRQDVGKPCCQKKCSNYDTDKPAPKKKRSRQEIRPPCCQKRDDGEPCKRKHRECKPSVESCHRKKPDCSVEPCCKKKPDCSASVDSCFPKKCQNLGSPVSCTKKVCTPRDDEDPCPPRASCPDVCAEPCGSKPETVEPCVPKSCLQRKKSRERRKYEEAIISCQCKKKTHGSSKPHKSVFQRLMASMGGTSSKEHIDVDSSGKKSHKDSMSGRDSVTSHRDSTDSLNDFRRPQRNTCSSRGANRMSPLCKRKVCPGKDSPTIADKSLSPIKLEPENIEKKESDPSPENKKEESKKEATKPEEPNKKGKEKKEKKRKEPKEKKEEKFECECPITNIIDVPKIDNSDELEIDTCCTTKRREPSGTCRRDTLDKSCLTKEQDAMLHVLKRVSEYLKTTGSIADCHCNGKAAREIETCKRKDPCDTKKCYPHVPRPKEGDREESYENDEKRSSAQPRKRYTRDRDEVDGCRRPSCIVKKCNPHTRHTLPSDDMKRPCKNYTHGDCKNYLKTRKTKAELEVVTKVTDLTKKTSPCLCNSALFEKMLNKVMKEACFSPPPPCEQPPQRTPSQEKTAKIKESPKPINESPKTVVESTAPVQESPAPVVESPKPDQALSPTTAAIQDELPPVNTNPALTSEELSKPVAEGEKSPDLVRQSLEPNTSPGTPDVVPLQQPTVAMSHSFVQIPAISKPSAYYLNRSNPDLQVLKSADNFQQSSNPITLNIPLETTDVRITQRRPNAALGNNPVNIPQQLPNPRAQRLTNTAQQTRVAHVYQNFPNNLSYQHFGAFFRHPNRPQVPPDSAQAHQNAPCNCEQTKQKNYKFSYTYSCSGCEPVVVYNNAASIRPRQTIMQPDNASASASCSACDPLVRVTNTPCPGPVSNWKNMKSDNTVQTHSYPSGPNQNSLNIPPANFSSSCDCKYLKPGNTEQTSEPCPRAPNADKNYSNVCAWKNSPPETIPETTKVRATGYVRPNSNASNICSCKYSEPEEKDKSCEKCVQETIRRLNRFNRPCPENSPGCTNPRPISPNQNSQVGPRQTSIGPGPSLRPFPVRNSTDKSCKCEQPQNAGRQRSMNFSREQSTRKNCGNSCTGCKCDRLEDITLTGSKIRPENCLTEKPRRCMPCDPNDKGTMTLGPPNFSLAQITKHLPRTASGTAICLDRKLCERLLHPCLCGNEGCNCHLPDYPLRRNINTRCQVKNQQGKTCGARPVGRCLQRDPRKCPLNPLCGQPMSGPEGTCFRKSEVPAAGPGSQLLRPNSQMLGPEGQNRIPHQQLGGTGKSFQGRDQSMVDPRTLNKTSQIHNPSYQPKGLSQRQMYDPNYPPMRASQRQMGDPNYQRMSNRGYIENPNYQPMVPQGQMENPNYQPMVPQGQMENPNSQPMGSQGQIENPNYQHMGPHGQIHDPNYPPIRASQRQMEDNNFPHMRASQRQMEDPNYPPMRASQRQMEDPNYQRMVPQGQVEDPNYQGIVPQGQVEDPNYQPMGPQGQMAEPNSETWRPPVQEEPRHDTMGPQGQNPNMQQEMPANMQNPAVGPDGQLYDNSQGEMIGPEGQNFNQQQQLMFNQYYGMDPNFQGQTPIPFDQMLNPHGHVIRMHQQTMNHGQMTQNHPVPQKQINNDIQRQLPYPQQSIIRGPSGQIIQNLQGPLSSGILNRTNESINIMASAHGQQLTAHSQGQIVQNLAKAEKDARKEVERIRKSEGNEDALVEDLQQRISQQPAGDSIPPEEQKPECACQTKQSCFNQKVWKNIPEPCPCGPEFGPLVVVERTEKTKCGDLILQIKSFFKKKKDERQKSKSEKIQAGEPDSKKEGKKPKETRKKSKKKKDNIEAEEKAEGNEEEKDKEATGPTVQIIYGPQGHMLGRPDYISGSYPDYLTGSYADHIADGYADPLVEGYPEHMMDGYIDHIGGYPIQMEESYRDQMERGYSGQIARGYTGQIERVYPGPMERGYADQMERGYPSQLEEGYADQIEVDYPDQMTGFQEETSGRYYSLNPLDAIIYGPEGKMIGGSVGTMTQVSQDQSRSRYNLLLDSQDLTGSLKSPSRKGSQGQVLFPTRGHVADYPSGQSSYYRWLGSQGQLNFQRSYSGGRIMPGGHIPRVCHEEISRKNQGQSRCSSNERKACSRHQLPFYPYDEASGCQSRQFDGTSWNIVSASCSCRPTDAGQMPCQSTQYYQYLAGSLAAAPQSPYMKGHRERILYDNRGDTESWQGLSDSYVTNLMKDRTESSQEQFSKIYHQEADQRVPYATKAYDILPTMSGRPTLAPKGSKALSPEELNAKAEDAGALPPRASQAQPIGPRTTLPRGSQAQPRQPSPRGSQLPPTGPRTTLPRGSQAQAMGSRTSQPQPMGPRTTLPRGSQAQPMGPLRPSQAQPMGPPRPSQAQPMAPPRPSQAQLMAPPTPSQGLPMGPRPSQGQPMGLSPSQVQPTGLRPSQVQPAGLRPSQVQPAGLRPSQAQLTGLRPSQAQPAGLRPSQAQPTGLRPSQAQLTGLRPSQAQSTGLRPSQAQPTGLRPSQAQPTGLRPSQAQLTGLRPSQAQPTGLRPSQAQPTGLRPSQAQPMEPRTSQAPRGSQLQPTNAELQPMDAGTSPTDASGSQPVGAAAALSPAQEKQSGSKSKSKDGSHDQPEEPIVPQYEIAKKQQDAEALKTLLKKAAKRGGCSKEMCCSWHDLQKACLKELRAMKSDLARSTSGFHISQPKRPLVFCTSESSLNSSEYSSEANAECSRVMPKKDEPKSLKNKFKKGFFKKGNKKKEGKDKGGAKSDEKSYDSSQTSSESDRSQSLQDQVIVVEDDTFKGMKFYLEGKGGESPGLSGVFCFNMTEKP